MRNQTVRTAIFVPVWTYVAATWASIAHHLVGLPDVVPAAAVLGGMGALVWTFRSRIGVPTTGAATAPQHTTVSE